MNPGNPLHSAKVHADNITTGAPSNNKSIPSCTKFLGFAAFLLIVSGILTFAIVYLSFWIQRYHGFDSTVITTSMSLADLDFSDISNNNNISLTSLNATINIDIELRNDYFSSCDVKYEDSSMFLRYKGTDIDVVPIAAKDNHECKGTRRLNNLTLRFMGHRLLNNSAFTNSDLLVSSNGGVLKLEAHVRIPGKGRYFGVTVYPVAKSSQDFSINLAGRSLSYAVKSRD